MFFGKKKKKSKAATGSYSRKESCRGSDSQSEIELACRDLMLASLESMRKDVISRPQAVGVAKDFDIAEKVKTDVAFGLDEVAPDSVASEIEEISDCGNSSQVSTSCSSSVEISKVNDYLCCGIAKQRIIDLIAAEDISRAFGAQKELRLF